MGLTEDLRLFVIAHFDSTSERKIALEGLNNILAKYKGQIGKCTFCNQEFDAEIKGLLFAREKVTEKYDVPVDFKIDMRLKELGWDVEIKGDKYK